MDSDKNLYKQMYNDMEQINVQNYECSTSAAAPPYVVQQPLQQQQESIMGQAMPAAPLHIPPQMLNYNPPVGPESTELSCPQCRCRVKTRVRHRSTAKTHIACLLLSLTLCCCCLPYCMDSCRNANHFCPMCGAFIGTYQS